MTPDEPETDYIRYFNKDLTFKSVQHKSENKFLLPQVEKWVWIQEYYNYMSSICERNLDKWQKKKHQ